MRYTPYYILLSFVLLLAGCSDKLFEGNDTGSEVPDGTPVVIDGTFVSPTQAGTRAMGEAPDIKSLYAIVFDENDLLSEIVPCQPGTYEDQQSAYTPGDASSLYKTAFHVVLQSSAKHRIVHLVANVEPQSYAITDEVTLLKNFTVSGTTDSYWRRIDLTDGILADATGTVRKDKTLKHFQNITLVRNFAKIGVSVDKSLENNFQLLGYYIFNQPASGTVAPYNLNAAYDPNVPTANRFADYVLTADASAENPVSANYFDLNDKQHYFGYEPSQMKLKDNPPVSADGSNDATFPFVAPSQPTYMYESTYTNGASDNPFIILKAKYRSDTSTDWGSVTPTYYKADFVYTRETDQKEEVKYQYNYNVLRNLSYSLDITYVNGKGRKTIQEAINNAAMNNFMMSSESQDLTNIAADKARLYVDWTDELFTSGGTHPLKVKFIYDKDNPTDSISNWHKDETGNPKPKYYVNAKLENQDEGLDPFIESITWDTSKGTGNANNDADGYRTLNIKFKDALPNNFTRQNLLITCSSGLLRRVTVSYIPASQMVFSVASDPSTLPTTAGGEVCINITLPSTLTEKRFPLHFHIWSTNNVLYPNVQATGFVEMPLTVTHSKDESYYHYNRYITWSEYKAKATDTGGTTKTFPCYFKLYKAASGYSVNVSPAPNDKTSNYFSGTKEVKN